MKAPDERPARSADFLPSQYDNQARENKRKTVGILVRLFSTTRCEKSPQIIPRTHPPAASRLHFLLAYPVDPHVCMLSGDQNFVQWFFHQTVLVLVLVVQLFPAPLPPARSFANKVYPDVRDVREQRGASFERRRERDAIVSREDCDRPAEATGERESNLAIASAQRYAERWTRKAFQSPVRGRWVVLFSCVSYINIALLIFNHRNKGRHWDSEHRRRTYVPLLHGESHRRCTSPRRLASTSRFHRG